MFNVAWLLGPEQLFFNFANSGPEIHFDIEAHHVIHVSKRLDKDLDFWAF